MLKLNLEQISQVNGGFAGYHFNGIYKKGNEWCVSYNDKVKTETKCFGLEKDAQDFACEIFAREAMGNNVH